MSNWEVTQGQNLTRVYEKIAKSYIFQVNETNVSIRYPKPHENTQNFSSSFLGQANQQLTGQGSSFGQPQHINNQKSQAIYSHALLFQIMVPENESFEMEFVISDLQKMRRRINFSSLTREIQISDFYAKIPNHFIQRRVWLNLIFDFRSFFQNIFKGSTYRSIDSIEIHSSCKIKRIIPIANSQSQIISVTSSQPSNEQNLSQLIQSLLPLKWNYQEGVNYENQIATYESTIGLSKIPITYLTQQKFSQASQNQEINRKQKVRLSPQPNSFTQYNKFNSPNSNEQLSNKGLDNYSYHDGSSKVKLPSIHKPNKPSFNNQNPLDTPKVQKQNRNFGNHTNLYSETNTSIGTRKRSIPSSNSHLFQSTDDNFQGKNFQQSNMMQTGSTLQHDLSSEFKSNNEPSFINPLHNNLKQKKGVLKPHPLSAVQKTNKMSNNLYQVVNNQLVKQTRSKGRMDLTDNEISHERLITKDNSPTASYDQTFNSKLKSTKQKFKESLKNQNHSQEQTMYRSRMQNQGGGGISGQSNPYQMKQKVPGLNLKNKHKNVIQTPDDSDNDLNSSRSLDNTKKKRRQIKTIQENAQPQISGQINLKNRSNNTLQFLNKKSSASKFNNHISPIKEVQNFQIEQEKIPAFINKTGHMNRAWYEESIREENENAEADEGIATNTSQIYGLNQKKNMFSSPSMESLDRVYNIKSTKKSPMNSKKNSVQTSQSNPKIPHQNKYQLSSKQMLGKSPYGVNQANNSKGQNIKSEFSSNALPTTTPPHQPSSHSQEQNISQKIQNLREKRRQMQEIENKYKVRSQNSKSDMTQLKQKQSEGSQQNNITNQKKQKFMIQGSFKENPTVQQNIINTNLSDLQKKQAQMQIKAQKSNQKTGKKQSNQGINNRTPNQLPHQNDITPNKGIFYYDYSSSDQRFSTSIFHAQKKHQIDEDDEINSIEENIERESMLSQARATSENINKVLGMESNANEESEEDEEDKLFYSDLGNMLAIGGGASLGLLNNQLFNNSISNWYQRHNNNFVNRGDYSSNNVESKDN